MKTKIIDYLLSHANPSIVLRVRKEITKDLSKIEDALLLEKILADKHVVTAVSSQKPNGWLGDNYNYHGSKDHFDNMEVGLRFLAEKGLPPEHPVICRAVEALAKTKKSDEPFCEKETISNPQADYMYPGWGIYLTRSSILIRAGYETLLPKSKDLDLEYDVAFSLRSFLAVRDIHSPEEIQEMRRGKMCFRSGVLWPCIYHLRMLAFSYGWRTPEAVDALSDAISVLYAFPKAEFTYIYYNGQLRGPCMPFVMNTPINETLRDGIVGGMYFDRLELFARCGALTRVKELREEYDLLLEHLDAQGMFLGEVERKYALEWSLYFGFALEEDWRSKIRRQCDVLFRVLMIMEQREAMC